MGKLKNLKHAVQVVIINDKGQILCVSRKDNHSDFGLPGGKVDPEDSSLMDAAKREVKEETGLDVFDLFKVFSMCKDGYMGHTYLAKWSGEINTDEPHVVKWGTFKDLMDGTFGKWNTLVCESMMNLGMVDFPLAKL